MTTALKQTPYDRLADPASAEAAHASAKARRARMERAAGAHPAQIALRARMAPLERRVPAYARRLGPYAPVTVETVLAHVAASHDMPVCWLVRPLTGAQGLARGEAIYWVLGLTTAGLIEAAARFELDAPQLAAQAMRAYARLNGLPTLDVAEAAP